MAGGAERGEHALCPGQAAACHAGEFTRGLLQVREKDGLPRIFEPVLLAADGHVGANVSLVDLVGISPNGEGWLGR